MKSLQLLFRLIFPLLVAWMPQNVNSCAAGGGGGSANADAGGVGGLRGILGGDISASSYSPGSNVDTRIQSDSDLFCDNANGCRWKNAQDDRLDWALVDGQPDPTKWRFATGTPMPFTPKALVLASNPRSAEESGDMVSAPIGCQNGDGQVTFKHWISRARKEEHRPKLEACWRYRGESALRGCQVVSTPNPGPSTLTIPGPIDGPFELVFRGSNFVASPEGGFIVLDDIQYIAPVEDSDGCQGEPPTEPTDRPTDPPTDRPTDAPTDGPILVDDVQSCRTLSCPISLDRQFCDYQPVGEGSVGPGQQRGWEVTTGALNTNANALTGVRFDRNRLKTEPFGLADFPDPRKDPVNDQTRFVLQSAQQVEFTKDVYLKFYRFLATQGIRLYVCRDPDGRDCFYESPQLDPNHRRWFEEVVLLPQGPPSDVFFIAGYDNTRKHNAGQVGLSEIQVVDSDRSFAQPLC